MMNRILNQTSHLQPTTTENYAHPTGCVSWFFPKFDHCKILLRPGLAPLSKKCYILALVIVYSHVTLSGIARAWFSHETQMNLHYPLQNPFVS